jgi:hypothetical protein
MFPIDSPSRPTSAHLGKRERNDSAHADTGKVFAAYQQTTPEDISTDKQNLLLVASGDESIISQKEHQAHSSLMLRSSDFDEPSLPSVTTVAISTHSNRVQTGSLCRYPII